MKKIERVFPFLWVKGEEKSLLLEEIDAIKRCGLNAFCVESRVHPDFCGETWFDDMACILQRAKELGMQVWILDDYSYPTGYAAGIIKKKYPRLKCWQIALKSVDVAGEIRKAKIPARLRAAANEQLLATFIAKRENNRVDLNSLQNVDELVCDNKLYTDIPSGSYRVYFLIKTQGYPERDNYIDTLNGESTDKLIEAVYQPHYERFKEYFGETLVGFFSDEPRLCNGFSAISCVKEHITFVNVGVDGVAYPYNDALWEMLDIHDPKQWLSLWLEGEGHEEFRCRYMKGITTLYAQNFNGKLSAWCHERGISYSGHIIEDNGAHLHSVCSAGHFFRAMEGADMAAIDVVSHQIKPYDLQNDHRAGVASGYANAEFFNFLLAKLASSAANLDERQAGNALCELFGAYGWCESTTEMAYLVHHLLSRGINYFIPHAFSMSYGDTDCPPHFFARGKNPAYKGYGVLFPYMTFLAETFSGGVAPAEVAVLYHDEAEWSGKPFVPCERIAKILTESQIDFDVVYGDMLKERAKKTKEGVQVGGRQYRYILVPPAQFLTESTKKVLESLGDSVLYVDGKGKNVCKQSALPAFLHRKGCKKALKGKCRDLRVYTYEKAGKTYRLFFNEGGEEISFALSEGKDVQAYDYLANTACVFQGGKGKLLPGQAVVEGLCAKAPAKIGNKLLTQAEIFIRRREEQEFTYYKRASLPFDVNDKGELTDFCGEVRYAFRADLSGAETLWIDYDGEFCECCVGGEKTLSIGGRMAVDTSKLEGEQEITLTLGNSVSYDIEDEFSSYGAQPSCVVHSVRY